MYVCVLGPRPRRLDSDALWVCGRLQKWLLYDLLSELGVLLMDTQLSLFSRLLRPELRFTEPRPYLDTLVPGLRDGDLSGFF